MSNDVFEGDGYSPIAMVERAVRNARPHRTTAAPRWVAVRDVFGYGSTTSTELCRRFGLDPHETVPGAHCDQEHVREESEEYPDGTMPGGTTPSCYGQ